jgi:uncharacterized membrane protein YdcZ (DUF606 family)
MPCKNKFKWINLFLLLPLLSVFCSFSITTPAAAAGGLGITGTFYQHDFRLTPGETYSNPDVYVMIVNNSSEETDLKMESVTPAGVNMVLTPSELTIPAGGQQKIAISLSIDSNTIPGDYTITIKGTVQPKAGSGIVVTSAVEQNAQLTVLGEAGNLHLTINSVDGQILVTEIHVYEKVNGQFIAAAYSATGELTTRLAPGDYRIQAYFQGTEIITSDFSIAANENKEISLVGQTILIDSFIVQPVFSTDTKKLVYINIIYDIKNIDQALKNAKAILKVSTDAGPLEDVDIFSVPTLDVGSTGGTYKYIPSQGWTNTNYHFNLVIAASDKVYGNSTEQKYLSPESNNAKSTTDWTLIGGIVAGVVIIVGAVIFFVLRRRKKPTR